MIRVTDLTKKFANRTAVDAVSFEVQRGEIVGFLGPNGAGKTTTMRMLAGFLAPTSGHAEIAGFDIAERSLEVRRRIGYLPETIPLYPEMRIVEYLDYRCRLKGVPRATRGRHIDEALERCGLADVRTRIVGQLSKGYRQRVGLADALVHKPAILILDEPTAGLDPNQIRDVRALIRELGREHTIILSTHILPEVEMVCGRVVIISGGKVLAQDTPAALRAQVERRRRVRVEIRAQQAEAREAIERVAGVARIVDEAAGAGADGEVAAFLVEAEEDRDVREEIAKLVTARGWGLRELHAETMSLEDVFHRITMSEEKPS